MKHAATLLQTPSFPALPRAVTPFVIIGPPRSGSTLLCGLLDSHPSVFCHYELFHPHEVALSLRFTERLRDVSIRQVGALPFLADLLTDQAGTYSHVQAIGFKILLEPSQVEEALDDVVACPGIRKIVLDRRNRLAAYSSVTAASVTGIWQSNHTSTPAKGLVRFEQWAYDKYVARMERDMARVERLLGDQVCLRLDYSDLLVSETSGRILDFLGLPAAPLLTDWSEIGFQDPLDCFENPDDVRDLMLRTGHADWLAGDKGARSRSHA